MKKIIPIIFLVFNLSVFSQEEQSAFNGGGFEFNSDRIPCLTPEQRASIILDLKESQALLKSQGKLVPVDSRIPNPLFIWPVQKAANVTYNDVWGISNYVDHNPGFPDQILDYNGGDHSYDTSGGYNHQGVDIFSWPFSWKMVEENGVEIIAASSGQIINKIDGNFDRSCNFNSNLWNAVYIRHNDGSVAWYGHMKDASLTTKNIGEMVSQGEYLGILASSGNSTGPHLHFEVYEDDTYTYDKLIDPYAGPSNNWNATSWWASQKPYRNPGINAVTTHTADPDFGSCPNIEITNEENNFDLNDIVYFITFLRDAPIGSIVNFKMYRPDNSLAYDENTTIGQFYSASWWRWSRIVDTEGAWRFVGTFNGESITHNFNVGTLSTDEFDFNDINVYPNPSKDIVYINSNNSVKKAILTDVLGKTIKQISTDIDNIREVSLNDVTKGLYFLTLEGDSNQKKTIRIIKN